MKETRPGQADRDLRIPVDTTRTGDVDDDSGFAVLHTEVLGRGADELEWRCVVHRDHGVPLLVGHLFERLLAGRPAMSAVASQWVVK